VITRRPLRRRLPRLQAIQTMQAITSIEWAAGYRPAPPDPPGTPLLTVYQGQIARGIATGNELIIGGQVLRGDQ
jgi:hypothetical protein